MNTQYRKNLKSVLEASKTYCDESIRNLQWQLGTYDLGVETDDTVAYTKTVPSGAIKARLSYIGGASKVSENKAPTPTWVGGYHTTTGSYWGNYTTGIRNETKMYLKPNTQYTISYKMNLGNSTLARNLVFVCQYTNDGTFIERTSATIVQANVNGLNVVNFTTSANVGYVEFSNYVESVSGTYTALFDGCINEFMLNSGSSALDYQPYFEGIRDSAVTSLVSKDSNNTTLDTYTIPAEVQALNGYGWGVNDTCYNYIDFENKKFIQKVDKYTLSLTDDVRLSSTAIVTDGTNSYIRGYLSGISINKQNLNILMVELPTKPSSYWGGLLTTEFISVDNSNGNILFVVNTNKAGTTVETLKAWLNGKIFYFELATPIETDISQYIDDDFKNIDTTDMTTITFENEFEYDVPSEIDYLIEEVKA